jgi:hypothetical protein
VWVRLQPDSVHPEEVRLKPDPQPEQSATEQWQRIPHHPDPITLTLPASGYRPRQSKPVPATPGANSPTAFAPSRPAPMIACRPAPASSQSSSATNAATPPPTAATNTSCFSPKSPSPARPRCCHNPTCAGAMTRTTETSGWPTCTIATSTPTPSVTASPPRPSSPTPLALWERGRG